MSKANERKPFIGATRSASALAGSQLQIFVQPAQIVIPSEAEDLLLRCKHGKELSRLSPIEPLACFVYGSNKQSDVSDWTTQRRKSIEFYG